MHDTRPHPRLAVQDLTLGSLLRHHGVTEFATRNAADFEGFGFTRLINPIDSPEHQVHDEP